MVARLWDRDATLWTGTDEHRWMGWLDAPFAAMSLVEEALAVHRTACGAGIRDLVLLGIGGSSLCAETLARTFGNHGEAPRLTVIDSTVPDQIARLTSSLDLEKTWFLVASKSGSTAEPITLFEHFYVSSGQRGDRFLAITDAGSGLDDLAQANNFQQAFYGDPEIGGRFSALSNFGLVPAVVTGVDVERLIARAVEMADACRATENPQEHPALGLGTALAVGAEAGRNKLTLHASPDLVHFGAWVEQLIAESTGKEGRGICPVVDEPVCKPESYGGDRLFVFLTTEEDGRLDDFRRALSEFAQPVVTIRVSDAWDLGGEFFRWEFATAVAAAQLGIHPFDQPDVQASKVLTTEILETHEERGELNQDDPAFAAEGIQVFTDTPAGSIDETVSLVVDQINTGDYLALCAYIDAHPRFINTLSDIRRGITSRGITTTLGFGPRYLHSTGQLHKGGANQGVFVLLTTEPTSDVDVPGRSYGFDAVCRAQALGDYNALRRGDRRVVRFNLQDAEQGLNRLAAAFALCT